MKILSLLVVLSFFSTVQAATTYHCNGKTKQSGSSFYHANGRTFKYGSSLYHINGRTLKYGSSLYHSNGRTFKYGSSLYHTNGQTLKYGSSLYHSNGQTFKYGNTCYYENGRSMGECPANYTFRATDEDGRMIQIEFDLESNSFVSYTVIASEDNFNETYSIDSSGEIISIDSTCSGDNNGSVDRSAVNSVINLFTNSNNPTKKEIKDNICH